MSQQTTSVNPAAQTLLSVLRPFLQPGVIEVMDILVPGQRENCHADVLLVGELETVAISLGEGDELSPDWHPEHPIGLITEVYTLSTAGLFYHLDDFAYLLSISNPSLFLAGVSNQLRARASETVIRDGYTWSRGRLTVGFPEWAGSDLEIRRHVSIQRGSVFSISREKAA